MSQPDGISHLVEEGIIDAVHARLMSGKEATVYVVERDPVAKLSTSRERVKGR